ncbi:MAG TPA: sugar transferase [Bacteroidales bacterium]|nr:MAG: UDP-glucose:undecaprenyl-phosphate glucose-1-phosphate transferase [Bacteroidetes bacterium ADurb.Bin217]HPM12074.1 sugar transferase [Bacteroidales bacterium]
MLKEKENIINNFIALIEVGITYITFYLAFFIRHGHLTFNKDYTILLLFIGPTWFFLLRFYNISRIYRVNPYSYIFFAYFILVSIAMGILFLIIFLLQLDQISRFALLLFSVINFFTLYILKIDIYFIFKKYRRQGKNYVNVIVIGNEELESVIKKIERNTFWGYRIVGIVTDNEAIKAEYGNIYTIHDSSCDIPSLIENKPIDEVIYTESGFERERITRLIYSCLEIGVMFRMSSQLLNIARTKSSIQYLDEMPFFTFQNTPNSYISLKIKTIFDFIFSLLAIISLSWLFIIIAILVKIDSKGPIIFKQTRVGLRGRKFQLYKFRSMIPDAEDLLEKLKNKDEQSGPVFKMKDDPRITPIGKFLRKTSLDELPQFFNVIKGDMSVVGPRPPIPAEVAQYERWQLRRLSMKPGITCIWQVSGRNNIPFERWMKLDLQYIDTWSLRLDFMIILKTIKTIIKRDGL